LGGNFLPHVITSIAAGSSCFSLENVDLLQVIFQVLEVLREIVKKTSFFFIKEF
jgi:hypothetical protein